MNRTKNFDQKYAKVIEDIKKYLLKNNLNMIHFTFTDGWNFKLSIPKQKWSKLKK